MITRRSQNAKEPSIDEDSANITICEHMYDDSKTLLEYLYEEGKCGHICRGGNHFSCSIPLE